MSKPLWFEKRTAFKLKKQFENTEVGFKRRNSFSVVLLFLISISLFGSFGIRLNYYAHANNSNSFYVVKTSSPLFKNEEKLFPADSVAKMRVIGKSFEQDGEIKKNLKENEKQEDVQKKKIDSEKNIKLSSLILLEENNEFDEKTKNNSMNKVLNLKSRKEDSIKDAAYASFSQKLYDIVGEAPIHEMVPFISRRNEMVAAFLVGIAKKESSFGYASPSKNGETCFNYWGYKGSGTRGTGMGYACFASPEEAIKIVGDRIEVLVNKERNTPARMVDTWKCGRSCVGDPGAPGWVSTVALYFNKIVSQNS